MFHFYTPWKRQKTFGFIKLCTEMGLKVSIVNTENSSNIGKFFYIC